ncbi:hypothetical protein D3C80_1686790 [compost metagenome]
MDHPARAVLLPEFRVFRVVVGFRLFLGVHVVEVAEELVETMVGRQMPVAITQVILAKLAGGIALLFHHITDRRCPVRNAMLGARHSDRQQAGAEGVLAQREGRAAGGAGLLAIGVGEQCAFPCDAVDVGGLVAHHPLVVGADIEHADIVTKDHQDVRFVGGAYTQ